jgi:hypothetical protein
MLFVVRRLANLKIFSCRKYNEDVDSHELYAESTPIPITSSRRSSRQSVSSTSLSKSLLAGSYVRERTSVNAVRDIEYLYWLVEADKKRLQGCFSEFLSFCLVAASCTLHGYFFYYVCNVMDEGEGGKKCFSFSSNLSLYISWPIPFFAAVGAALNLLILVIEIIKQSPIGVATSLWWIISPSLDVYILFTSKEGFTIHSPSDVYIVSMISVDTALALLAVYFVIQHRSSKMIKEYEEAYIKIIFSNTVPLFRLAQVAAVDIFFFTLGNENIHVLYNRISLLNCTSSR